MTISVLVPSYRRVLDLRRCLSAIATQTCLPTQILVVAREEDSVTIEAVNGFKEQLPIDLLTVSRPGVVNALNAGLNSARGTIIAITDDDSAPRPDWLERIERHFANSENVGGVGGRDWLHMNEEPEPERTIVGEISWYGRIIGNHHLGIGAAREVHVLKGVNMSFRANAITGMRFDDNLRGEGAQVWLELGFCLELKKKGWKLIYDPAVAVDHYPSIRHDRDQRSRFDKVATENRALTNIGQSAETCIHS